MGKEAVAYDINFDREIVGSGGQSESYIKKQIETHLGERFHTLLSTYKYGIKDGEIVGEDLKDSFLETIKKGRDYRRKYGQPMDWDREDAEVNGFEKIQKVLANPESKIGTMMLSISPRGEKGSTYVHNFYDVFTLCEDQSGKRFIEAKRYSSALTPVETVNRLQQEFSLNGLPFPNDVSLLSNPLEFRGVKAEQIHALLHKKHHYVNTEDFECLKKAVQPYIESYIQALSGKVESSIAESYDALLNHADDVWLEIESSTDKKALVLKHLKKGKPSKTELLIKGSRAVREVMTGCGNSGSSKEGSTTAYSVSDFGKKDRGYDFDQPGPCANCGRDVKCGPCHLCLRCVEEIESAE